MCMCLYLFFSPCSDWKWHRSETAWGPRWRGRVATGVTKWSAIQEVQLVLGFGGFSDAKTLKSRVQSHEAGFHQYGKMIIPAVITVNTNSKVSTMPWCLHYEGIALPGHLNGQLSVLREWGTLHTAFGQKVEPGSSLCLMTPHFISRPICMGTNGVIKQRSEVTFFHASDDVCLKASSATGFKTKNTPYIFSDYSWVASHNVCHCWAMASSEKKNYSKKKIDARALVYGDSLSNAATW